MKELEKTLAKKLDRAALEARPIPQIAQENEMDLRQSYTIQRLSISRRLARYENIVGYKLGFTSKAKMEQMGVHDLIWGILTDAMEIKAGGTLSLQRYIHPRAEPEIAFLVRKDFDKILRLEDCHEYIESCAAAIEIIDSRYENFKFTLEDVVADNCSSSGFVLGEWRPIPESIEHLTMQMFFDDVLMEEGSSFEILENPLLSVVELSRLTQQDEVSVKAGEIILAGASTQALFLKENISVNVRVEHLGEVGIRVKK